MPAIPGEALDCIVYLYPDAASAANGEDAGGCGFVAAIPSEQTGLAFTYVVTNSHVVKEGNSPVVRVNTGEAQFQIISAEDRHWIIHPGATKERIEQFKVGPGDEVFIPGSFCSLKRSLKYASRRNNGFAQSKPDLLRKRKKGFRETPS
jgi:hypothetical protein